MITTLLNFLGKKAPLSKSSGSSMSNFKEKLIEKIGNEEGRSEFPYLCPGDKLTIGYGFNLESTPMPKVVADFGFFI